MQTIELLIIFVFVCIQVYFFLVVNKKTKLISSLLPKDDTVSVYREYRSNAVKGVKQKRKSELISMSYVPAMTNSMFNNSSMLKRNSCPKEDAVLVVMEYADGGVYYRPCCPKAKFKYYTARSVYCDFMHGVFDILPSPISNDEGFLTCIEPGKCERLEQGWKVIEKAKVEV